MDANTVSIWMINWLFTLQFLGITSILQIKALLKVFLTRFLTVCEELTLNLHAQFLQGCDTFTSSSVLLHLTGLNRRQHHHELMFSFA